jgi:hypothetical protein
MMTSVVRRLGYRQMNNPHDQLRAAQERRAAINQTIDALDAEGKRLDKLIVEITPRLGDASLPCWTCTHPQSVDARHWLNANQDPRSARSPSGLPMSCCRVVRAQPRSTTVIYA